MGHRMTAADRQKLDELYGQGLGIKAIAQEIGFDRTSIYRELIRGYTGKTDWNGRPGYDSDLAQSALGRRWKRQNH